MSITAKEIQEQGFEHSRRGYDVEEVDIFLERVANEVDALNRQNEELRSRIAELQSKRAQLAAAPVAPTPAPAPAPAKEAELPSSKVAEYESRIAQFNAQVATLQAQLESAQRQLDQKGADASTISAAFISAQKSADSIREEARSEGEKIYREAEGKAREIVRDALAQKQQALTEYEKLKNSREQFRVQYQELLRRFSAEADREFAAIAAENDSMNAADVAAQEKDAVAEMRAAAAKAPAIKPGTSYPATGMPGGAVAVNRGPVPATPTTKMPAASRAADLSGYGDTDETDIQEIE